MRKLESPSRHKGYLLPPATSPLHKASLRMEKATTRKPAANATGRPKQTSRVVPIWAMENPSTLRLPPGFRFHPTDEELVFQYLRRKALSCPVPASIIPEIDLGKHDPWDLHPPGGRERERYFFALRETKYANGGRSDRVTGSGYWKATGKHSVIAAPRCRHAFGTKKTLVFYRGKAPKGSRTDWMMHEYRLTFAQRPDSTNGAMDSTRDWVLCRIFKKKRAASMHFDPQERAEERRDARFIDFMGRPRDPSSPSASSSSCVTDTNEDSNRDDTSSFP